jgi:hypothetical protein
VTRRIIVDIPDIEFPPYLKTVRFISATIQSRRFRASRQPDALGRRERSAASHRNFAISGFRPRDASWFAAARVSYKTTALRPAQQVE